MIPQDEKNLLVSQTVARLKEEMDFLFHLHNITLPPLLATQFERASNLIVSSAVTDGICSGIRYLAVVQSQIKGEIKDE